MEIISKQIFQHPYKNIAEEEWLAKHTNLTLEDIDDLRSIEKEYLEEFRKN